MSEAEKLFDLSEEAREDYMKGKEAGLSSRALYNRLYYAAFYAAKAALLSKGIETKTHRGAANRLFEELYNDRGSIERDTAAFLAEIQSKRDKADYDTGFSDSIEEVEEVAQRARKFIESMREVFDE